MYKRWRRVVRRRRHVKRTRGGGGATTEVTGQTAGKTKGKLEGRRQWTRGGGALRGQELVVARSEVSQQPSGKQEAKWGEAPADKEARMS